jgi:3-oxoacyl-ACP reductase-like protein
VYIVAQQISLMGKEADPQKNAKAAIDLLGNALTLHTAIQQNSVFLADKTNIYQANWKLALEDLLKDNQTDFAFLELMS